MTPASLFNKMKSDTNPTWQDKKMYVHIKREALEQEYEIIL